MGKGGVNADFRFMLKYFKIKKGFSLLYKTNRFYVAVRLLSVASQKTSKCDNNISDTLGYASCATFLFGYIFVSFVSVQLASQLMRNLTFNGSRT